MAALQTVRKFRTLFRDDAGMTQDRYDPAKDAINREKHRVSLAQGDRIFEDDDHVIVPSIREVDGEELFKVIGIVGEKRFPELLRPSGQPAPFHVGEKEQLG